MSADYATAAAAGGGEGAGTCAAEQDLLEVDDECIQGLVGDQAASSVLGAADKAEVLNHLANFGSLQESDFLPPGKFCADV